MFSFFSLGCLTPPSVPFISTESPSPRLSLALGLSTVRRPRIKSMSKLQPHSSCTPPMGAPIRAPSFVSTRRQVEQKLADLHKCKNLLQLKQLHAQILKANLHQDPFLAPKLVSAFSLCRNMALAVKVFRQVEYPNVHLYNCLMKAHIENSEPYQALITFFDMQRNGVFPDNFTYPLILRACTGPYSLQMVQMIHTHIEKFGFSADVFVPNALIDSYCKCGQVGISSAWKLFTFMQERDVVSWNSMISGLVKGGQFREACHLFDEMPQRDVVSWNTILDGYVKAGDLNAAFDLFQSIPKRNVVSWSTMVAGYARAGDMEMARMMFDKMPAKNLVSWTIMISGYAEKGLAEEAISLFDEMQRAGLAPDDATIISILAACAESGLLTVGKRVHASMAASGFRCSVATTNALIEMYARCGIIKKALHIFEEMTQRDLVSWNTIIHGLAMYGLGDKALEIFSRMEQEGFQPDEVTFVGILCACTHMGFVDRGLEYFHAMEREYAIVPSIKHYGCLIDLLGRRGRLREAFDVVKSMPFEPNAIIWGTLLGACRMHNAVELSGEVLEHLIKLEPTDAGNFSMLSNIYAAAGDWANVANVRLTMKNIGMEKPSGASSIELGGHVHEFTVFDNSHPKSESIYQMINVLRPQLKKAGYVPRAGYG